MLGVEDADGAKASEAQDIGSAPAAEAPADTAAIEAHSEAVTIAEPSKEEQGAGTAADATQQPQASTAADAAGEGEDPNIPTAAGQGRGKRGRGGLSQSGKHAFLGSLVTLTSSTCASHHVPMPSFLL